MMTSDAKIGDAPTREEICKLFLGFGIAEIVAKEHDMVNKQLTKQFICSLEIIFA